MDNYFEQTRYNWKRNGIFYICFNVNFQKREKETNIKYRYIYNVIG